MNWFIALLIAATFRTPRCSGVGSFLPILHDPTKEEEKEHTNTVKSLRRVQVVSCPPAFSGGGICSGNLDTCPEWQACALACVPAGCCADTCQTSCASCLSYIPCQGLGGKSPCGIGEGPPTSPPNENKECPTSVLPLDYSGGFLINFQIKKSDAEAIMPYSRFFPMDIRTIERLSKKNKEGSTPKTNKAPKVPKMPSKALKESKVSKAQKNTKMDDGSYLVTLNASKIAVQFEEGAAQEQVGRGEVTTYAINPDGDPSLIVLAAFIEVPAIFQLDESRLRAYKDSVENSALDSRTGQVAYPHYFVFKFHIHDDGIHLSGGDLIDDSIIIQLDRNRIDCEQSSSKFSRDFVATSTLVYRSPVDKIVNFFNKNLIDANIQELAVDIACYESLAYDSLLKFIPHSAKLDSIQQYGLNDEAIRRYYEVITSSDDTPYLTLSEKEERIDFKRTTYSTAWLERSSAIISGEAESILKIKVKNSSYINWEISAEKATELAEDLGLKDLGLTIIPNSILDDERERYFLTLNAYDVIFEEIPEDSGGVGVRFEFNIYVKDQESPHPHFMVIEALTSVPSYDPVYGEVSPTDISLLVESNEYRFNVWNDNGDIQWLATLSLNPNSPTEVNKYFIMANDIIYWPNGVADRGFFANSATVQKAFAASTIKISGTTTWDKYLVDPMNPIHAMIYKQELEFPVVPWFNLNSLSLNFPSIFEGLKEVKKAIYGGLAALTGNRIATGLQEPYSDLITFGGDPRTPRLVLNFEIKVESISNLEKLIALPDDYHLAQIAMTNGSKARYLLTFECSTQAFTTNLDNPFLRATWSVYIKDASGQIFMHQIHSEYSAENSGLDIEEIVKGPAKIFDMTKAADLLLIDIQNKDIKVNYNVLLAETTERRSITDEWMFSFDKFFGKKGVYHKVHYNGETWKQLLETIPLDNITILQETPWSNHIGKSPIEAYLFERDAMIISHPWYNIEEL